MATRKLRSVGPDEKPPAAPRRRKKPPMTLSEAIDKGDYLEILKAQRRDIVASLPNERGPAKAALHRQMALVSKEIEAIEEKKRLDAGKDPDLGGDAEWDAEAI